MLGAGERKGFVYPLGLCRVVGPQEAGGGRRRLLPAGIDRPLATVADLGKKGLDLAVDEEPGAHVLGLFLAPHDIRVRILDQLLAQRLPREGLELLDPQDGDLAETALVPPLLQVVIDLAGAQTPPLTAPLPP